MHVLSAALAASLAEVPSTAKEAGEKVKGIVMSVAATARLLVLFETFVPILVIDLAGLGGREGVVGFGYGDKFVVGRGIISRKGEGQWNLEAIERNYWKEE